MVPTWSADREGLLLMGQVDVQWLVWGCFFWGGRLMCKGWFWAAFGEAPKIHRIWGLRYGEISWVEFQW